MGICRNHFQLNRIQKTYVDMTKHEERIQFIIDSVNEKQESCSKITDSQLKLMISGIINAESYGKLYQFAQWFLKDDGVSNNEIEELIVDFNRKK